MTQLKTLFDNPLTTMFDNVELAGITRIDETHAVIDVKIGDTHHQVESFAPYAGVGSVGRLESNRPATNHWRFVPYLDQTLRRAVEFDSARGEFGWRCASKPNGFRAPASLLPGENGLFMPDRSREVVVRVPEEFLQECGKFGMTPEAMLGGFAADAAGITNWHACPRADGLTSNGSDEREMADAWMMRAYGHRIEDVERWEEHRERAEQASEIQDDFNADVDDVMSQWINESITDTELVEKLREAVKVRDAAKGLVE